MNTEKRGWFAEWSEELSLMIREPLDPQDFYTRLQAGVHKADPPRGVVTVYTDARAVNKRFNSLVGPSGWSFTYEPIPSMSTDKHSVVKGIMSVLGSVQEDIGTGDGGDREKGAVSDAKKRCAVSFGFAEYLYEMPEIIWPTKVVKRGDKEIHYIQREAQLHQQMYELSLMVYANKGDLTQIDLDKYLWCWESGRGQRFGHSSPSNSAAGGGTKQEGSRTQTPLQEALQLLPRKIVSKEHAAFILATLGYKPNTLTGNDVKEADQLKLRDALLRLPDLPKG